MQDFAFFDHTQPVRLLTRRADGVREAQVPWALARSRRRSEQLQAGVGLPDEVCLWLLPAEGLPAGIQPRPADRILAGDDVWSIDSAELGVAGSLWRCRCRLNP